MKPVWADFQSCLTQILGSGPCFPEPYDTFPNRTFRKENLSISRCPSCHNLVFLDFLLPLNHPSHVILPSTVWPAYLPYPNIIFCGVDCPEPHLSNIIFPDIICPCTGPNVWTTTTFVVSSSMARKSQIVYLPMQLEIPDWVLNAGGKKVAGTMAGNMWVKWNVRQEG